MSDVVIPLRPASATEPSSRAAGPLPPVHPRALTYPAGTTQEQIRAASAVHLKLIEDHLPKITALVARILHDRLPALEQWVGALLGSPGPDGDEPLCEIGPRSTAIEFAETLPLIQQVLREPPIPDRLDTVVEAEDVVVLASIDIRPALPVTRKQAEALHLPAQLLFAKGDAFTSVRDEPADLASLQAAFEEHVRVSELHDEELLEDLARARSQHPIEECAGVVLSLGEEGRAVTVLARETARRLLVHHPFLDRKLIEATLVTPMEDGRKRYTLPVVVWAKGHVSVQTRDVAARE
jgi:hypothetical protein